MRKAEVVKNARRAEGRAFAFNSRIKDAIGMPRRARGRAVIVREEFPKDRVADLDAYILRRESETSIGTDLDLDGRALRVHERKSSETASDEEERNFHVLAAHHADFAGEAKPPNLSTHGHLGNGREGSHSHR